MLARLDRSVPMLHGNFPQPTLAIDMLLLTSHPGVPYVLIAEGMLSEGSNQMASKASHVLVSTFSPCVDTGDVGCFGLSFVMPFLRCDMPIVH